MAAKGDMMASNIRFIGDIRQAIIAGLVLSIETARAAGPVNADASSAFSAGFMRGVLAMARHQALVFGIPWAFVACDARIALGDDLVGLLELGE